jgi:hypothetical protein
MFAMMLATICTFKALLQTFFLPGGSVLGRWNSDNNGKNTAANQS